jgi:hypothetical protein
MSDGAIKIELTAEDKASAVVNQAAREAERAAKRIEKTTQDYSTALKLEKIQLEQGAEAAEAFRLQLQGLDEQTAKNLASEKAAIAAQKQMQVAMEQSAQATKAASEKLTGTKQSYINALRLERIHLEQGAEAAEAYRLELQGLDKATAQALAREKQLLTDQKQAISAADKHTQATARKTKASIEFFGTISNFAGGGAISQVSGQLAGLTEKTSQFAEVAKEGGAAALAMQAGLALAAGSIGMKLGQEIGSLVFQVERWNTEVERSIILSEKWTSKLAGLKSQSASDRMSFFDAMPEGEQEEKIRQRLQAISKEIAGTSTNLSNAEKKLKELQEADVVGNADGATQNWFWTDAKITMTEYYNKLSGEHQASKKEAESDIRTQQALLDGLNAEKTALERKIGIEKELKALREPSGGNSWLKLGQEAASDVASANREQEQSLEKLNQLKDRELEKLQEEITLLERGKEAAHALRLEKQGLSKEDAAGVAAAQAKLDELNELKNQNSQALTQSTQPSPELQANESRLLTTGRDSSLDTQKEIAKLQEEQKKIAEQSRTLLGELKAIMQKMSQAPGVRVEVVS